MSDFLNPHKDYPAPHASIQYKGTDLCMDFQCACGAECHFDGFFANVVQCPECAQEWEMPAIVFPRKRCEETYDGWEPQMMDAEDD